MNMMLQVTEKVKQIFDEDWLNKIAKESGFIKRKRKIKAKVFLEKLLIHQMQMPHMSLQELATEITEGETLKKQSLHQKINYSGKEFLRLVLEKALEMNFIEMNCLKGMEFIRSIDLIDSTQISLRNSFEPLYPKTQGKGAAIKVQACIELMRNQVKSLELRSAREPDQGYEGVLDQIEAGTLQIGDLGYFSIERFKRIEESNAFFLSRYFKSTHLYEYESEEMIDLRARLKASKELRLDLPIKLGRNEKFPCRLIAVRLSEEAYEKRMRNFDKQHRRRGEFKGNKKDVLNEWSIFVTNLPIVITTEKICDLYYLRWQIELFFKALKSWFDLRSLNHSNEHRVALSLYVSLISIVLLSLLIMPISEKEISLYKASKLWKRKIGEFFFKLFKEDGENAISWLEGKLYQVALIESRRSRPSSKAKVLHYA
jgi:Transposase DDE domain